jgi:hypothetical protein
LGGPPAQTTATSKLCVLLRGTISLHIALINQELAVKSIAAWFIYSRKARN